VVSNSGFGSMSGSTPLDRDLHVACLPWGGGGEDVEDGLPPLRLHILKLKRKTQVGRSAARPPVCAAEGAGLTCEAWVVVPWLVVARSGN
jgi:hypothetical protein